MTRQMDRLELAKIFDENYDLVYRTIAFRVPDRPTAEDLTSEVFARLVTAAKRNRMPDGSPRGWLLTVARNVVADHYRKQNRWKWTQLTEDLMSLDNLPGTDIDKAERLNRLNTALKRLPDVQQQVLALRFGAKMSARDTADVIGKKAGAVRMIQVRAIAALARDLKKVVS